MSMHRIHAPLGLLIVVLQLLPALSRADCGSIPFNTPLQVRDFVALEGPITDNNIQFNPLDVVVYEPGQRAIILWNGDEEILLLSTDIKTSQGTPILEVMPFPSEPTVTLGEFETFEKMQRLLIDKTLWRVASGGGVAAVRPPDNVAEITFFEAMGAHDIAVVKVKEPAQFSAWVMNFLRERQAINPQINPAFLEVIDNYLERGYQWFVFDTLYTDDELQSKQPVQFRFKSPHVYYPLEISSRETGKTTVDLLLLTHAPVSTYDKLSFAVQRDNGVQVTHAELEDVSPDWAAFMAQPAFSMQRVYIKGKLSAMTADFIVR
ncbi:MAG: DUF2330 domain-containing protein [Candidatus Competibacteraceae bacterium]|nr:DUF2330 domain-containing protein [Candidatus Competibacteraceae bacterium]